MGLLPFDSMCEEKAMMNTSTGKCDARFSNRSEDVRINQDKGFAGSFKKRVRIKEIMGS
jgi:hypothetical protein